MEISAFCNYEFSVIKTYNKCMLNVETYKNGIITLSSRKSDKKEWYDKYSLRATVVQVEFLLVFCIIFFLNLRVFDFWYLVLGLSIDQNQIKVASLPNLKKYSLNLHRNENFPPAIKRQSLFYQFLFALKFYLLKYLCSVNFSYSIDLKTLIIL